ncbi:endonuclease III related protein [Thermotomaculum hydrothermale]|uniref:Endonuclease III related protein n=1 Tax=Thermotomaculum hydrothermale TaxID=981385 RepID=A0A7R6PS97_9BACT|nr:hypothetical protein [Thermotomaculum hydrothermale]BBB31692.1 endonuclease III related protein [Thermotomaculum hydrothermale]
MKSNLKIEKIRQKLFKYYGSLNWWPAETPFEVCVGAILTQNTAWKNVEKAIENLKRENLLSCKALTEAELPLIARLIKPSGYFNQKAKKLKEFCSFLSENYNCSLGEFFNSGSVEELRGKLLSIWGIGKETADSILLYAGNKPIFVVDAYTKRILSRHGICEENIDYEKLRMLIENSIKKSVEYYNEFHAALVYIGKDFCSKKKPLCDRCPLKGL